jgi:hypothetical protein
MPSDSHQAVFLDDIGNVEMLFAVLKSFETVLVAVEDVVREEGKGRMRTQRSFSFPQSIDPALTKMAGGPLVQIQR